MGEAKRERVEGESSKLRTFASRVHLLNKIHLNAGGGSCAT